MCVTGTVSRPNLMAAMQQEFLGFDSARRRKRAFDRAGFEHRYRHRFPGEGVIVGGGAVKRGRTTIVLGGGLGRKRFEGKYTSTRFLHRHLVLIPTTKTTTTTTTTT